jgi:hypothetical protein
MSFIKSYKTWRKAVAAFLVPTIPGILAAVQAKWGLAGAAEVTAILTALGVYTVANDA